MLAHQIAALFWLLGSLASVQASPTPHTSAAHSLVGYAPHLSSAPTPSIEGPPGGPAQGPGLSQCNAQCTFAAAEKVDCDVNNALCICDSTRFQEELLSCYQGCTEEENAQALDLGQSFCADKGLPLNTVVTLGSLSTTLNMVISSTSSIPSQSMTDSSSSSSDEVTDQEDGEEDDGKEEESAAAVHLLSWVMHAGSGAVMLWLAASICEQ